VIRPFFSVLLRCCASLLAGLAACGLAQAQGTEGAEPAPQAMILIAAPGIPDSNFERSVVLVTRTPVGEMIGVILNRPTGAPWPRGLRPSAPAASRQMHFGGPLIPRATFSVGEAGVVVADTLNLGEGLRFAVGLKNTQNLANAGGPEGALKLFNGYAGWGPGQLEAEIAAGIWQVRPVSAALVFDPVPATQWERLTALQRAVRAPPVEQGAPLAARAALNYRLGLALTKSMRLIDCTRMSFTSAPCSTLSGTAAPAWPRPQSFL